MGGKGIIYGYYGDVNKTTSCQKPVRNETGSSLASLVVGQCFQIRTPLLPSAIPK